MLFQVFEELFSQNTDGTLPKFIKFTENKMDQNFNWFSSLINVLIPIKMLTTYKSKIILKSLVGYLMSYR